MIPLGTELISESREGLKRLQEREAELHRLYAKRDAAFQKVKRIETELGTAENEYHSIKHEIAELHRANGARG